MCEHFLADYLIGNPSSILLDIMYTYNMSSIQMCLEKVKLDFNIIFNETIEKYVFLKLSYINLYSFLNQRHFHSSDEFYFIKGIVLWIKNDIDSRIDNTKSLFSLIDYRLCNKNIMLENKLIDTGNSKLDVLIQKLYILISIFGDKSILQMMNDNKIKCIDSFNIPHEHNNTIKKQKCNSLCKLAPDGIYDIKNNNRIFHYNFGQDNKVIYINSYLLIINFMEGKMFRYNNISKEVIICNYPSDYLFNRGWTPTVNVTIYGNLITIGGFRNNNQYSNEVKIYNPNTDKWSDGKSLPYSVCAHSTLVVGEDIYVIGGATANGCIDTVIRYRGSTYCTMTPLLHIIYHHFVLLRDNCIYVYCGSDRYGIYPKPECYNIKQNYWSSIITDAFNDVKLCRFNSVYDKPIIYMYSNNNIYSLCLDNYTKTLLYTNIKVFDNCLFLMNL